MTIRRFALCAPLLAACLAAGAGAPAFAQSGKTTGKTGEATQFDYDWVLYYYMAYDNNLEGCGRPILDMLKKGVTSERTLVVVSADFRDQDGMRRYVLTQGEEAETRLPDQEGSAEEETLASELAWVGERFKARKYAIVFLNHGGRLGEMSHDEHPGSEGGQNWLYPPDVAPVLTAFRKEVPGEVELMFYQQCGKGTLENVHAMKDTAKFIMASQTVVGAPNYYYTDAVKYVGEHPEIDGKELAKQFTERETANMFTTYTTFDAAALGDLPAKLAPVLAPLRAKDVVEAPKFRELKLRPCFDMPPDEVMFDGFPLLAGLYQANGLDEAPLDAFKAWVKESLITSHRVSPDRMARASSWCGFSIYVPLSPGALSRYAPTYPIYQQTELDELWGSLMEKKASKK